MSVAVNVRSCLHLRRFFARSALCLFLPGVVVAQQELPNFDLWQDSQGFLWQLNRAGALGSADASYFNAAMALHVKGAAFTPSKVLRAVENGPATETGTRYALTQEMDSLRVRRDVWFDRARSGVRLIDVFENTGARRESVRIEFRSSFQNPWQDLHGSAGRILGTTAATNKLGERDFGVVVKFSPSEGRHDTLFVTSGESDALRPAVTFSSNLREMVFSYDLEIEPGKSAALLHWIVQRNLQTPAAAAEALRPFYQRRQLVDPVVPPEIIPMVRNFDPPSFPSATTTPAVIDALVSLNAVVETLDLARRADDILWITAENQVAGTTNPEAIVRVQTAHGDREAKIAEVAAIQGGGGVGRTPRVFLRDGRVWAGEVTAEKLSMKTKEGWEVDEMRPEELSLLLLRVGKTDGAAPTGAGLFVETRAGDVLALSEKAADATAVTFLTPWGDLGSTLGEVAELAYVGGPGSPRFRLLRRDGSLLTAFLSGPDLSVNEAIPGSAPLTLSPRTIVSAWRTGSRPDRVKGDLADEWFDLDDAKAALGAVFPDSAVVLAGNNLLHAGLAMESLSVVAGATVTPVDPAEVIAIRQSIDSDPTGAPIFEIELAGGQTLTGRLRETSLVFREGDRNWTVPVTHFVAFARKETPPTPAKPK